MTKGDLSIAQWTKKFGALHKPANERRRPEEFWIAITAHSSALGECVRRSSYRELFARAAHLFCWLCSYVQKCNEPASGVFHLQASFSEWVAFKYPGVCGHCMLDRCACDAPMIDATKDKAAAYKELLDLWNRPCEHGRRKPWSDYSLNDWIETLRMIYSGRIHLQPAETIGFHLLEEVGEGAEAVRQLVQVRSVADQDPRVLHALPESLQARTSSLPNLVQEYDENCRILLPHARTSRGHLHVYDTTSRDPLIVRARFVYAKMSQVIELADTFSWLCALVIKIADVVKALDLGDTMEQAFDLEAVVRREYSYEGPEQPLKCYACNLQECRCWLLPMAQRDTPSGDENAQG